MKAIRIDLTDAEAAFLVQVLEKFPHSGQIQLLRHVVEITDTLIGKLVAAQKSAERSDEKP